MRSTPGKRSAIAAGEDFEYDFRGAGIFTMSEVKKTHQATVTDDVSPSQSPQLLLSSAPDQSVGGTGDDPMDVGTEELDPGWPPG